MRMYHMVNAQSKATIKEGANEKKNISKNYYNNESKENN